MDEETVKTTFFFLLLLSRSQDLHIILIHTLVAI